jgi:hypothetical protein
MEWTKEVNSDKKYAWKRIPPKDGDPVTKKVHVNGISKTYYWCPYHLQWTVHSPQECKRLPTGKGKSKPTDKKAFKRSQFKERKKAYVSIPLISALKGTLQGVSKRSPGRSRPRELGHYGLTRQPYGRTRLPEG